MPFNTGNIILRYFGRSNLTVVNVLDYITLWCDKCKYNEHITCEKIVYCFVSIFIG